MSGDDHVFASDRIVNERRLQPAIGERDEQIAYLGTHEIPERDHSRPFAPYNWVAGPVARL